MAEVTGSIPVSPTPDFPCGCWASLGQSSSLIAVAIASRLHCVHIRIAPWRVEGVGSVAVEAFIEVAVDVKDGLHARVSES